MTATAKASTLKYDFPNIDFREAPAESLPFLEDGQVDMVVAGQAAHWFDYPRVWGELWRLLRREGTLAFWGYKDHAFVNHPRATAILRRYSHEQGPNFLGSYWAQPGRRIVEDQYHDIHPPVTDWADVRRIEYEPANMGKRAGAGTLMLERTMTLGQCKGYIRTWSSYHAWREAHPDTRTLGEGGTGDIVDEMFDEMVQVEPDWQLAGSTWEELPVDIEWGSGLLLARKR